MLLGKFNYESISTKLQEIQETKGNDAVKSWCIDFGMDLKQCNHCKDKTPVLHSISAYKCAICRNTISND